MSIFTKKWKDYGILEKGAVFAGAGIGVFAIYSIVKNLRSNVKKAPVDYGQIPQVFTSGGKPVLWDPDPLAKEIFENLEGYNLNTYPETTNKILKLNKEQLKLLYNYYNTYYAQEYPTLTKLLASEWTDWSGSYSKAVAKLRGAGLY
jgi:acetylornithine/succinyldiaminopimelate/putrescine aminotransferase